MKAPVLLKRWRDQTGTSQSAAAEAVDVRQATWCAWEAGKAAPHLEQAIKIEAATNGAVPIESWSDDPAVQTAMRQALERRASEQYPRPPSSPPPADEPSGEHVSPGAEQPTGTAS